MVQDKFPQFEVAEITLLVANTSVRDVVDFPNDLAEGEVLELTSISAHVGSPEMILNSNAFWEIDIQTRDGELQFENPDIIYRMTEGFVSVGARTNETGVAAFKTTWHYDLTDGQGRGVLVPADRLYVSFDTSNYTGTPSTTVRIYYRIVTVSKSEVLEFLTSA